MGSESENSTKAGLSQSASRSFAARIVAAPSSSGDCGMRNGSTRAQAFDVSAGNGALYGQFRFV